MKYINRLLIYLKLKTEVKYTVKILNFLSIGWQERNSMPPIMASYLYDYHDSDFETLEGGKSE